jgi:hypothetical protein
MSKLIFELKNDAFFFISTFKFNVVVLVVFFLVELKLNKPRVSFRLSENQLPLSGLNKIYSSLNTEETYFLFLFFTSSCIKDNECCRNWQVLKSTMNV